MARGGRTPILGAPEQRPTDEIRAPAEAVIRVDHLYKSFGLHEVLHGVTLDVVPREVLCVIGLSGSSKSTLVRCIAALEEYDRGRVYIEEGQLLGYGRPPGASFMTMRATHASGTTLAKQAGDVSLQIRASAGAGFPHIARTDSREAERSLAHAVALTPGDRGTGRFGQLMIGSVYGRAFRAPGGHL
jgi:hypothetical protein